MSENPVYRVGFGLLVLACAAGSFLSREGAAGGPTAARATAAESRPLDGSIDDEDDRDGSIQDLPSPAGGADKDASRFGAFKNNYLLVYALVMTADWLQGPSTYPLYKSYGYDLSQIAILFVVGFLSSAIFGTLIGSFADRAGRKLACLVFCAVYSASCITKLSSDFSVLLLGRLLGGVSTSLLFSVFESWMVSEHHSRGKGNVTPRSSSSPETLANSNTPATIGFKEGLLSDTFSWSTFINGLVAILSGILANVLSDHFGLVAPFMGSMAFLIAAALVVGSTWRENYGGDKATTTTTTTKTAAPKGEDGSNIMDAARAIWMDSSILAVGVMQCFYESAMYTFVFLWSPVLEAAAGKANIPFGLIFAAFMVSIMIGSVVFKVLLRRGAKHEDIAVWTFAVACVSLLLPVIFSDETTLFFSFNLFELCCGLYFPTLGTLRSKLVPEETRTTVMNVFRVPLNLIVVVALLK
ncbi:Molybdate-anion transporter, partial [Thoreauomyces humboldtii]